MMLQYKRLSLSAARVSEISVVKNLVSDYIRADIKLEEHIRKNTVSSYLVDGKTSIKYKLEKRIDESGYEGIVIKSIEEVDNEQDNLANIHVLLEDIKLGKEEDVYVVIFTK